MIIGDSRCDRRVWKQEWQRENSDAGLTPAESSRAKQQLTYMEPKCPSSSTHLMGLPRGHRPSPRAPEAALWGRGPDGAESGRLTYFFPNWALASTQGVSPGSTPQRQLQLSGKLRRQAVQFLSLSTNDIYCFSIKSILILYLECKI